MLVRLTFLLLFIISFSAFSQKKAITHDDYDLWKQITNTKISDNGNLVVSTVELTTKRGDGHVQIYNVKTGNTFTFDRGYNTAITADENYVIFKQKPAYDTIRKEKKKKVKKEELSKDKLFIYDVKNNAIYDSILNVKNYNLPKEGSEWLVIEKFKNKKEKNKKKSSDTLAKDSIQIKEKKVNLAFKQDYAIVYKFKEKHQDTIFQIKDIAVPYNGNTFVYSLKHEKKKEKDLGIFKYNVTDGTKTIIDTSQYIYQKIAIAPYSNHIAYTSAPDSTHVDSLKYELNFFKDNTLKNLINTSSNALKKGWVVSKDVAPYFSKNGERLYYNSKPEVHFHKDTTLLDEDIPQVDVWHWKDKMIQPEQKSKNSFLSKKAFLSYYNTQSGKMVQIQDETINSINFDREKTEKYVFGSNDDAYAISRSWDWPFPRDYYIINTLTGEKKKALTKKAMGPILHPDNKYALYFDLNEQDWFSLNLETQEKINLTKNVPVAFHDEDDDHPALAYPHGFGGFNKNGSALVYDKYDIWELKLNNEKSPVNITKNGRQKNIEYRTLRLDRENRNLASYLNKKMLVTSFNKTTKVSGLYTLSKGRLAEKIKPSNYFIRGYRKAKNADAFIYTQESFQVYPDLKFTNNSFKTATKITDLNPHEKDFKWGTVEQFSWTAYDGTKLDGLIYKPENFDPSKKYPLISYFYEKRSDNFTRHSTPSPSRSIVNPTYLVSNGYVMFVPDIVYKDGKPGPSAYNCIVSGVEAVEKLGYIDSDNMAIQGQSWGGYQVAYLITVTNKFKAAMAGAPVSNMTSAYGGIRWQSGLSRAFQYERSQSRLGKNLWDGFDLYIENSPLFGIPKIETPLLMMHNDADGAVPYYQGIEMFMGMRRLQKPVWLLVYNKEAHNLTKIQNRQDLSIRMMQFFDHYLKGEPAPKWMTKGLPRVNKGKDFGYELNTD